jgi:hypothetical protein
MTPFAALVPLLAAMWLVGPLDAAAQPPEPVQQQEAPARAQEAPREAPQARAPQPAAPAQASPPPAAAPQPSSDQPRAQRRPPSDRGGSTASGGGREPQAVPRSRPREGRPVVGQATRRVSPPPQATRPVYVYRSPSSRWYSPYGYGAFGMGYFYYDPWAWSPYGYGGYYGGYPRWGGPYGYDVGSVRLRVTPKDAEVLVDGYYAGIVDDFNGLFQSLKLDTGAYRIEVRKPGYETLVFDVRVQSNRKITFRGDMVPIP